MSGNDIIKFFFSCFIAALVIGIAYVGFRLFENPSSEALANLPSSAYIHSLPSSICSVASSDFAAANTGMVYIYHGAMRFDVTFYQNNQSSLIHIIIDPTGEAYIWTEGATEGVQTSFFNSSQSQAISKQNYHCSPWWIPDASLFEVPGDIHFNVS